MTRREVLVGVGAGLMLAGCRRETKVEALPVLGQVKDFTLTNQNGKPFGMKDLAGRVWIADFFFTNCPGPCPRMSTLMGEIQARTKDVEELRIVSITVDPERDTPEAMKAYGERYGAIDGRWHFLTGERALLHRLASEDFRLFDVDGSLQHSTRFALVDQQGQIRGYYTTGQDGSYARIPEDVQKLIAAAENGGI